MPDGKGYLPPPFTWTPPSTDPRTYTEISRTQPTPVLNQTTRWGGPKVPKTKAQLLHEQYPDLNVADLTFLTSLETDETGTFVPSAGNQTLDWIAKNIASQHFDEDTYARWLQNIPQWEEIQGLKYGKYRIETKHPATDESTFTTKYLFPWDIYYATQQQAEKGWGAHPIGQKYPSWLSSYLPTPEQPFPVGQAFGTGQYEAKLAAQMRNEEELRKRARALQLAPTPKRPSRTWSFAPPTRWLSY